MDMLTVRDRPAICVTLGLSEADPAALELSERQLAEAEQRLAVIRPALKLEGSGMIPTHLFVHLAQLQPSLRVSGLFLFFKLTDQRFPRNDRRNRLLRLGGLLCGLQQRRQSIHYHTFRRCLFTRALHDFGSIFHTRSHPPRYQHSHHHQKTTHHSCMVVVVETFLVVVVEISRQK